MLYAHHSGMEGINTARVICQQYVSSPCGKKANTAIPKILVIKKSVSPFESQREKSCGLSVNVQVVVYLSSLPVSACHHGFEICESDNACDDHVNNIEESKCSNVESVPSFVTIYVTKGEVVVAEDQISGIISGAFLNFYKCVGNRQEEHCEEELREEPKNVQWPCDGKLLLHNLVANVYNIRDDDDDTETDEVECEEKHKIRDWHVIRKLEEVEHVEQPIHEARGIPYRTYTLVEWEVKHLRVVCKRRVVQRLEDNNGIDQYKYESLYSLHKRFQALLFSAAHTEG